ncbi:MAG: hypothetical protein ACPG43_02290 [Alcanivoracaceae bacterium]
MTGGQKHNKRRVPSHAEEFGVWPYLPGFAALVALLTFDGSVDAFRAATQATVSVSLLSACLFSLGMGVGLALPLHGKYWLGFTCLAFLCYVSFQVMRWVGVAPESLALVGMLTLMFLVQGLVLHLKRLYIHTAG